MFKSKKLFYPRSVVSAESDSAREANYFAYTVQPAYQGPHQWGSIHDKKYANKSRDTATLGN